MNQEFSNKPLENNNNNNNNNNNKIVDISIIKATEDLNIKDIEERSRQLVNLEQHFSVL